MDRASIKELLREVIGPNTPMVDHPNWVGIPCALAPWTHASGRDSAPSAGISVNNSGTSIYHCYSCGAKNTVQWFLRQIDRYTGDNHEALIREIEDGDFFGGALQDWGAREQVKEVTMKVLDRDTFLDIYESANDHPYLARRGISNATSELLDLRVDPSDSAGAERILFPVFGRKGHLFGFTGRATSNDVEPRVRDYHGLPKRNVLLGEHLIQDSDRYVVVVEGLFDYANLAQCDIPVVATLHAGITACQRRLLLEIGKPIIWMFDEDTPGKEATIAAAKLIGKGLPMLRASYLDAEPGRVVRSSVKGKRDPACLTPDMLKRMIEKARIL